MLLLVTLIGLFTLLRRSLPAIRFGVTIYYESVLLCNPDAEMKEVCLAIGRCGEMIPSRSKAFFADISVQVSTSISAGTVC